jgi:hypothetical protein
MSNMLCRNSYNWNSGIKSVQLRMRQGAMSEKDTSQLESEPYRVFAAHLGQPTHDDREEEPKGARDG